MDIHSKLANGKTILFLLSLFLLVNFFVIPAIYPKFETLDMQFSYTPDEAYELISSYGEQGRVYYAVVEGTLDVAYPLITALLFSLITLYTFKKAFPDSKWVWYLSLTSYLVLLVDYLENICVITMLLAYPRKLFPVAQMSNFFTVAKFALTPLQLLFVIGLIGWLIRAVRAKPKRS
jgi:hypothetical protein